MSTMSWGTLNDKKAHFLLFKLAVTKHKKGKTDDNRAVGLFRMSNGEQKKNKGAAEVDSYVSKLLRVRNYIGTLH